MKGDKKLGGAGKKSKSKIIMATVQSRAAKQVNNEARGGAKKGFRR